MKKFFMLMAVASMGVMANAQSVEELQAKAAEVQQQLDNYDDGIAKKWEFRFDLAGETTFTDDYKSSGSLKWEEALGLNIGGGYNFNSNFYAGIATGYAHRMGRSKTSKAPSYIPALLDLTYRWNFGEKEKWSFFIQGRGGYYFGINSNQKLAAGGEYEFPNALYVDVQPGIYYRIKPNMDLKFSVGYAHISPKDDTPDLLQSSNMLMAKIGMNFRKAPKMIARTEIEEAVAEPVVAPEPVVEPTPEPVKIVETTTPEQKQLGQREVVIYYNIRMHNILPEKDALLQEMAEFVKTHKTGMVVLKSYADKGTGNYRLNQMYSRNRMNEVKKHLIEKYGIPADKIDASYYGDTVQPFEENDLNRCSIITVFEVE